MAAAAALRLRGSSRATDHSPAGSKWHRPPPHSTARHLHGCTSLVFKLGSPLCSALPSASPCTLSTSSHLRHSLLQHSRQYRSKANSTSHCNRHAAGGQTHRVPTQIPLPLPRRLTVTSSADSPPSALRLGALMPPLVLKVERVSRAHNSADAVPGLRPLSIQLHPTDLASHHIQAGQLLWLRHQPSPSTLNPQPTSTPPPFLLVQVWAHSSTSPGSVRLQLPSIPSSDAHPLQVGDRVELQPPSGPLRTASSISLTRHPLLLTPAQGTPSSTSFIQPAVDAFISQSLGQLRLHLCPSLYSPSSLTHPSPPISCHSRLVRAPRHGSDRGAVPRQARLPRPRRAGDRCSPSLTCSLSPSSLLRHL